MLGSALVRGFGGWSVAGYDSDGMDITSEEMVESVFAREKPDIVIHTAAYTDVDGCERDPEKAYRVNTMGTWRVVSQCMEREIPLVYISSTGVYGDDTDTPHSEFDPVAPRSVHHRSKVEAEKIVRDHLGKFLIVRTGWLFGGDIGHRKNFVYKRYLEAREKETLYSDASQRGNPTCVEELSGQIELLLKKKVYGVYNCVNRANGVTRLEYVSKIVELFGLDCRVAEAPDGMFERVAPVSKNESARNCKLDLTGLNIMGDWEPALERYIERLRKEIR